ncbi:DUF2637 domain-containing protein [Streptomyces sp. WELS2]|uniref:DUF2637 domain-containing protein n=1 Tax=Streptomyces sp. WELS2 TaxID=2749435 RepID=UPI0015EFE32F|nr:DUF2637 domain-containing protein [Streptomyces sp. WELS2]
MRAHLARVDAVVVQAVIAGALSFSHLHDLAAAAGQGGWKAWAYPVSVDLLLVASWRRMRQLQRTGQVAGSPRLWFLVALAASLGANVATAGLLDLNHVPASLRVVVAGWPAVAFFGGTLLAHTPDSQEPPGHSDSPTAGPYEEQTPAPAAIDVPVPEELPEPTPGEPEAVPDPPSPGPAIALPPALIQRARALADEQRSTTGRPADPDAVRARLGLPPSMTASVAAHL